MDDAVSPQKCHTLNDRANIPGSEEDGIGETPNEDASQDLLYGSNINTETPAIAVTLMSLVHANKDCDEQGEVGDAVNEDVDRNGTEEDENKIERVGDVANQSHGAAPHGQKAKWPHK